MDPRRHASRSWCAPATAITTLEYRSPAAIEVVLGEYVRARQVFQTFMEWAVAHDFEAIFHDMIYILHFIQDFQLYKKQNPERLFMEEARPTRACRPRSRRSCATGS